MQMPVYQDAVYRYGDDTKWLAIIDMDEYMVPVEKNNLADILEDYKDYPALGVNWVMFDSNGIVKRPDKLVIEAYTRVDKRKNIHIKSIVQPKKVLSITNPHFCIYRGCAVNENKEKIRGPFSEHLSKKIKINHYHTKSYEDYIRKRLIGYACNNSARPFFDSELYAFEYERDYDIQKYLPKLKEKMGVKD